MKSAGNLFCAAGFMWLLVYSGSLCASEPVVTNSAQLFYGETSANFIMRWNFQEFCTFVFDPRTTPWAWPTSKKPGGVRFNPKHVKAGDVIFVRDMPLFFQKMHPSIEQPYIIVTHGECRDTCKDDYLNYLDDEKIIAWFGIHPCKSGHEKYFPLPLGVKQGARPLSRRKAVLISILKILEKKLLSRNYCM